MYKILIFSNGFSTIRFMYTLYGFINGIFYAHVKRKIFSIATFIEK